MGGPSVSFDRLFDPTEFSGEELSDVLLAIFLGIFTAWFNPSSLRLAHRGSRTKILYALWCLKSLPPFKPLKILCAPFSYNS
ncbi:hypothetical protein GIB67_038547 [Kingdonia uniflora]|uniref:Uncharacterized protein n=1 Tax=Kingdonia uniflora TaxID=39325 RepID=A0A7J7NPS6_9MAGN|nr:hypothetical protein GIB67_038547 [Kingdonia uniflora]